MDGWREGGRGGGEEEDEEGGGEGGLTIREKFRPVKVSFLPIVLLIKTAPAPELIEGLSLSLTLSPNPSSSPPPSPVLLTRQLVCEEERKREKKKKERKKGRISAASWCYHQPATTLQLISLQLLLKGQGWDRTIMNTSSLPQQRN